MTLRVRMCNGPLSTVLPPTWHATGAGENGQEPMGGGIRPEGNGSVLGINRHRKERGLREQEWIPMGKDLDHVS